MKLKNIYNTMEFSDESASDEELFEYEKALGNTYSGVIEGTSRDVETIMNRDRTESATSQEDHSVGNNTHQETSDTEDSVSHSDGDASGGDDDDDDDDANELGLEGGGSKKVVTRVKRKAATTKGKKTGKRKASPKSGTKKRVKAGGGKREPPSITINMDDNDNKLVKVLKKVSSQKEGNWETNRGHVLKLVWKVIKNKQYSDYGPNKKFSQCTFKNADLRGLLGTSKNKSPADVMQAINKELKKVTV